MPLATPLPEITAPPLACDCHLHLFGDPQTYPYSAERRNPPPQMPLAAYRTGYQNWARRCGVERMVFTQPSSDGRDSLLDAITLSYSKARGIVDIDDNATDANGRASPQRVWSACASTLARASVRAKRA